MRGCARAQGGVHAAGRGGKGGGAAVQRRPHVLVCAPSNGALDEIVIRVVRDGLTDGRGRGWKPRVVRVGVSVHHTLSHVSLEALVQAKMADHQVRKPPPPFPPSPPTSPVFVRPSPGDRCAAGRALPADSPLRTRACLVLAPAPDVAAWCSFKKPWHGYRIVRGRSEATACGAVLPPASSCRSYVAKDDEAGTPHTPRPRFQLSVRRTGGTGKHTRLALLWKRLQKIIH